MLNVGAVEFYEMSCCSSLLLPDRDIVPRMARIASGMERRPFDKTAQLVMDIMAFAQWISILSRRYARPSEWKRHRTSRFRSLQRAQTEVSGCVGRARNGAQHCLPSLVSGSPLRSGPSAAAEAMAPKLSCAFKSQSRSSQTQRRRLKTQDFPKNGWGNFGRGD